MVRGATRVLAPAAAASPANAASAVGAASAVRPVVVGAINSVLVADAADATDADALTRARGACRELSNTVGAVRLRNTRTLNSPSVAELLPLAHALPSLSVDDASECTGRDTS